MKRSVGWLWVVSLGGLVACTVPDLGNLGPFPCQDSSSCAPGYTCIQGLCSSGQPQTPEEADSGTPGSEGMDSGTPDAGPLDTTPPILTLTVPSPPPNKGPVGKTVYTETGSDGRALSAAWRRDQEVAVELRTDSPLPLTLTLTGTDGKPVSVDGAPLSGFCDSRQCVRAVLPLWKPRLDAERGTLTLTATARDEAGNTTVQKADLPVTRWKWAYSVFNFSDDNSVEATPAIGVKGTLYLTTYYTTLIALSSEGLELWSKPGDSGGAEGAVVVGNPGDGRELIYARNYWESSKGSGSQLIVYDAASAATSSPILTCPQTQTPDLYIENYALVSPGSTLEGVVAPTNGGASGLILGLSASGSSPQCQKVATSYKHGGRGNTVVRTTAMFFTDTDDEVASMTLGSGTVRTGWPVSSASPNGTNGMALLGDVLVMGEGDLSSSSGVGGISTVSVDGGKGTLKYLGGPISSPVVGLGSIVFGVDLRGGRLVRASLVAAGGSSSLSAESTLDATLAPTLGQGGLVYAMFPSEVGVWSASDLKLQWRWGVGYVPTKAKRVAPTLDCTRDSSGTPIAGRPGVLYATIHNRVTALVVDSAGLDPDAPWPKYQHDEHNSGNPAVSVQRCP